MAAFGVVVCWVFTYTPDEADRPGSPKSAAPKCAAFLFFCVSQAATGQQHAQGYSSTTKIYGFCAHTHEDAVNC
jgi:hypothetical protein